MGIDTKEGMDAQVYTYTGYNSKQLVLGTGNVQINKNLGQVDSKV
jgi:hypothetical protein